MMATAPSCRFMLGCCLDSLRTLPDGYVQMVMTSPPFWRLRDYGVEGQIGMEQTLGEYIAAIVSVFREVRRVIANDGVLWMELGDCYVANQKGTDGDKSTLTKQAQVPKRNANNEVFKLPRSADLKRKDLVGVPWRVALALQDDGWYLRSDVIWHKTNAMPESVTDRPTRSHSYLFLLTKSKRYYYDQAATLEPISPNTHLRVAQDVARQAWSSRAYGGSKTMKTVLRGGVADRHDKRKSVNPKANSPREKFVKQNSSFATSTRGAVLLRNKRTVWAIPTQPYKHAHFATFPEALVEPCILAGSRIGDTVLDPFGGSGTVGKVAIEHGRHAILMELNPEYMRQARVRVGKAQPHLFPEMARRRA